MAQNNQLSSSMFTDLTPQKGPDVEFFDPPMCCPTGVCGPTLDQTLLDTSEMIDSLMEAGFIVERYQMSTHPQMFISNPDVMKRVQEKQMEALPIVIVHGKVIAEGTYPSMTEVQNHLDGEK